MAWLVEGYVVHKDIAASVYLVYLMLSYIAYFGEKPAAKLWRHSGILVETPTWERTEASGRASFSLPTLCTTYLRNRPSSPVKPSGVYSLSQNLTERHEKSLPRSTQPACFGSNIAETVRDDKQVLLCWVTKVVTQHWKMNISVVHYFCTFILGGRDPLMVCNSRRDCVCVKKTYIVLKPSTTIIYLFI